MKTITPAWRFTTPGRQPAGGHDRGPAALLAQAVHDPMLAVGPVADGIILFSRRRLLELIRVGDADGAAAEMEQHLRRLRLMWRLSRSSEPGGVAV